MHFLGVSDTKIDSIQYLNFAKMIQFNIQFKIESKIIIQKIIYSKLNKKIFIQKIINSNWKNNLSLRKQ